MIPSSLSWREATEFKRNDMVLYDIMKVHITTAGFIH